MEIPEFIKRMVGHADKVETSLVTAALLATANARITSLESEIVTLKAAASDVAATVTALTGEKATLTTTVATHAATITTLTAELATSKGTANAVIAAQGIDAAALPAAGVGSAAAAPKETAWEKYQRLAVANSREAGAFWATNADEILRTRPAAAK
jgi:peptidoglycan hydrolase CwlO-like protein